MFPESRNLKKVAGRTALLYVVGGALWIFFSDTLLHLLTRDEEAVSRWSMFKGWAFVFLTGTLLYLGLRRQLARWSEERKASEEANAERRRLESQLSRIATVVPGALTSFRADPEGRFSFPYADERLTAIYGIPVEEMKRDAAVLVAACHEEDRPRVLAAIEASRVGLEPFRTEFRVAHAERGEVWVEVHARPERESDGSTVWHGVAQDITERKRGEEEIRRTTELLRAVADGTPDAVFVKDLEGRYLLFNKGAARLVGRSVEEVLGQDDTAIFGPDDARRVRETGRRVMETGQTETAEEVLTAAGVTRTYLATKAPYRDGRGKIIGLVGISRDISERKASEEALRKSEARYRTLFEYAPDGILIGDANSYYLDANTAMCRMLGYTLPELVGMHASQIIVAEECAKIEPVISALHGGADHQQEWRFQRKDGSVFPVEVISTKTPDGNLLGMIRDVTERKQLEAQFLRAQRMESIGTLAGGIAHDLNNVLSPIMMSLAVLKMRFPDAESHELLSIISASAERGADMVRQVLSFARGVEGRRMDVQVRHLVADIAKIAAETFPKNIEVRTAMARDLGKVSGDPTQIHQVLMNLCVNARDAMPDGGRLMISGENITVDEQYAGLVPEATPGPHVLLRVVDSGTGMPPEVMEKIFDPFFTTKDLGKGTGLGLSTSMAIVKSHGGFLRVSSAMKKGTTFECYLPAKMETSETAIAPEPELPRGDGEMILVVDDEEAVRRITQQTLEAFGYRVLLANDGTEAVAMYAQRSAEIAAVLTDLMMPEMDGPATIQVLRRLNPALPIIAASGLATADHVGRVTNLGVRHVLAKPYSAAALLQMLKEVLAGVNLPV